MSRITAAHEVLSQDQTVKDVLEKGNLAFDGKQYAEAIALYTRIIDPLYGLQAHLESGCALKIALLNRGAAEMALENRPMRSMTFTCSSRWIL